MLDANFWNDKIKSKKIIKEKKLFEDLTSSYEESFLKLKDLDDLNELAIEENNSKVEGRAKGSRRGSIGTRSTGAKAFIAVPLMVTVETCCLQLKMRQYG